MSLREKRAEVVGAVFPVLREHVSNLFDRKRSVFVKFTKLNLSSGSTVVFYVSGEKLLVGEAKIRHIEKLDPDEAWSRYKDRVFLDKEEYDMYVAVSPISKEGRKMREVTVLELESAEKYGRPVRPFFPATPAGRYITKKMIQKIRKDAVS